MNDMGWEKKTTYVDLPLPPREPRPPARQLARRSSGCSCWPLLGVAHVARLDRRRAGVLPRRHGRSSRPSGSASRPRRPALERPPAALLLPVPLPARRGRRRRARPHRWPRSSPRDVRTAPSRRSPSATAVVGSLRRDRRPGHAAAGDAELPVGIGPVSVELGGTRADGSYQLAVPVDRTTAASSPRGPAGTSPATRARPPTPSTTTSCRRWATSARPTAAAGPCGSTRSSTTATARRWR